MSAAGLSTFEQPPTSPRILVVDDDAASRNYFRSALAKQGCEVVTAQDGMQAQGRVREFSEFDCAVVDYRMPGMDGIELLSWLQTVDPNLAVIMATAEGDKVVVEKALTEGASGFLNKPVKLDDLQKEVRRAIDRSRENRRLAHMARTVEQVGESQRSLVANGAGRKMYGIRLSHFPHHQAGGDFFVRFPVSETETAILAADVSGHDLEAAFLAAYFQGLTRGMLHRGAPVEEVLKFANRMLLEEWGGIDDDGKCTGAAPSIAVCTLLVDSGARTVTVLANGCPLPVLTGVEGVSETVAVPAYPLGWFEEGATAAASYPWQPGSSVRMWTDGVEDIAATLAVDSLAVVYALGQLNPQAARPSWLMQAHDDILAAVVSLSGEEPGGYEPLIHQTLVKHQIDQIEIWQESWRRSLLLALGSISSASVFNILLCAREAVLNALQHGCRSPGEAATIQAAYHPGLGQLRLTVKDPGPGHEYCPGHGAGELRLEHRGLEMIELLAQRVTRLRRGAELQIDLDVAFENHEASENKLGGNPGPAAYSR